MATTTSLIRRENVKQYLPDMSKNYVWGAALVIGGLIAIYYWGKNNATVKPAPLPNDTQPKTDPNTGAVIDPLTDSESKEIIRIANLLNDQMGYLLDPDLQLLNDFLGSSDRVFVGTYNYYNSQFVTAPDTLKTKINSYASWKLWFTDINNQMNAIVARMDKLNLK